MSRKTQKWTDEELAILAKNYPVMGAKGCVNATFSCLLRDRPELCVNLLRGVE